MNEPKITIAGKDITGSIDSVPIIIPRKLHRHNIAISDEVLEFIKTCVKYSRASYSSLDGKYPSERLKQSISDHDRVIEAIDGITKPDTLADDLDFILDAINE